jgi:hypothetical protein
MPGGRYDALPAFPTGLDQRLDFIRTVRLHTDPAPGEDRIAGPFAAEIAIVPAGLGRAFTGQAGQQLAIPAHCHQRLEDRHDIGRIDVDELEAGLSTIVQGGTTHRPRGNSDPYQVGPAEPAMHLPHWGERVLVLFPGDFFGLAGRRLSALGAFRSGPMGRTDRPARQ